MKPKRQPTPLFVFDDCVDYLQEWYTYAKKFGLTQKEFVKKAGIGAQAFLSDVLARRKKIGERHIAGIIRALELTGDEAAFFSLLVQKDTIKKPREREKVFRKLAELREKNLSAILDKRILEYFASWKYPVIREYIVNKGLVISPREIVAGLINLHLNSRDVEQTLKKLLKWDMIVLDKKTGGYRPQHRKDIISYDLMPHAVVNDVKRTMIETSIHAMETMEKDKRHVSMAIRGLNEKKFKDFCRKIDALRKEFLELDIKPDDTDRIVSMNIQMFPVMNIEQERNKDGRGK